MRPRAAPADHALAPRPRAQFPITNTRNYPFVFRTMELAISAPSTQVYSGDESEDTCMLQIKKVRLLIDPDTRATEHYIL